MKRVCFSRLSLLRRRRLMLMRTPHQSLPARQTNSSDPRRTDADGGAMESAFRLAASLSLPPLSIKSPTPKLTPQRAGKRFLHGGMPLCVLWCTYAPYFTRHRQVGGSGGQHGFENFPITFTAYSHLLSVLLSPFSSSSVVSSNIVCGGDQRPVEREGARCVPRLQ